MKKKKIYVAGKVYDLATMSTKDIMPDVQNRLDAHYGNDYLKFYMSVWKNEVTITFLRRYNEWYHPEETNNIFCADMDLITGRGIDGFEVPCMWPMPPFGYPFSTGIEEFITCYKESAKELGASKMKNIKIEHSESHLNVKLFY